MRNASPTGAVSSEPDPRVRIASAKLPAITIPTNRDLLEFGRGSGALDGVERLEGGKVLGGVMDTENRGAARERRKVGGERAD